MSVLPPDVLNQRIAREVGLRTELADPVSSLFLMAGAPSLGLLKDQLVDSIFVVSGVLVVRYGSS